MKIGAKIGPLAFICLIVLSASAFAMRGNMSAVQPELARPCELEEEGQNQLAKAQLMFAAIDDSDAVLAAAELRAKVGEAHLLDAVSPTLIEVLLLVGAAIAIAALPLLLF